MTPSRLSHELREEHNADLARRRWVVGLSIAGVAMGQIITLYQLGILKRLPDPPLPIFDSSKIDASDDAYRHFLSPDGPMMMVSYAVTAWLASAGGKDRARDVPAVPVAFGLKVLGDAAVGLAYTGIALRGYGKLCAYCQTATVASLASAVLATPEAIGGLKNLLGGRRG